MDTHKILPFEIEAKKCVSDLSDDSAVPYWVVIAKHMADVVHRELTVQEKLNARPIEDRLRGELDKAERINKQYCKDWAEDHTHLENLCKKAGIPQEEIDGDGYSVMCIQDLADLLAKRVLAEQAKVKLLMAALKRVKITLLSPKKNDQTLGLVITEIDLALAATEPKEEKII